MMETELVVEWKRRYDKNAYFEMHFKGECRWINFKDFFLDFLKYEVKGEVLDLRVYETSYEVKTNG